MNIWHGMWNHIFFLYPLKKTQDVEWIKDQRNHHKCIYYHSNSWYGKAIYPFYLEYCSSRMEHIQGNFIAPSNPLDFSNIFTYCTFSHDEIFPYVFHIIAIVHIQSYWNTNILTRKR